MKLLRLYVLVLGLIACSIMLEEPALVRSNAEPLAGAVEPLATLQTFIVHGPTLISGFLAPGHTIGDANHTGFTALPQHGLLTFLSPGVVSYGPNYAYVGSDSFTYNSCQNGTCTPATVDLDVQNNAPTPGDDSYSVHGGRLITDTLNNDSDPDGDHFRVGDQFHSALVTLPQHGGLTTLSPGTYFYAPNYGFVGSDSFSYQICDDPGLCSTATVTLNVQNLPPDALDQFYVIRKPSFNNLGSFLEGVVDPDGDPIRMGDAFHARFPTFPQHGTLTGLQDADHELYAPTLGYVGLDSFTIQVCDDMGDCDIATV